MKRAIPFVAIALASCGAPTAETSANVEQVVRVSLPDEPAAGWDGVGGALIERNCLACHSREMVATQPLLSADKWQATIDKMRTVYGAKIPQSDDAVLIAALQATQAPATR